MKRAIFLYNPIAGDHTTARKLDHIVAKFQKHGILLQPYRLIGDGFKFLPQVLVNDKYDFVIASGGDGSLNYIVNIMMKNNLDLPLGIVPSGTCNDFGKSLKIPCVLDECIDIILKGKTRRVDVGLINEEFYFLGTLAGGFFVDVSFNTHNELKKNFGPIAYYLKAITEVANIKSFDIRITTEEAMIEESVLFFLILNGKDAAGFSDVMREADISDGFMDILLVKDCSHIDLAALLFKALSREYLDDKNIFTMKADKCLIEGRDNIAVSVDGEKGPGFPMAINFINKALKVYIR